MGFGDFFRRVLIPVRQRPSSADLNAMQWRADVNDLANAGVMYGQNVFSAPGALSPESAVGARGFSGGGFYVAVDAANPPFGVYVQSGLGYNYFGPANATNIDSNQGADWELNARWAVPLALSQNQSFTVPPPPAVGNSRIDIIEVRADYLANDPQTVGIFNTGTEVFNPTVLNKSLTWDLYGRTGSVNAPAASTACISYVTGQVAAGDITAATEPTTTAGYIKIAQINLDASAGPIAAVTQSMIADHRPLLFPQGMLTIAGRFTTAGKAAGLGSINFDTIEAPPGVRVAAVVNTGGAAPAVGTAYLANIYVIGGGLVPRSPGGVPFNPQLKGAVAVTAGRQLVGYTVNPTTSRLTLGDVSLLDGTTTGWSVYGDSVAYGHAFGQPYYSFGINVYNPTGAALNNTEAIFFTATLNLG